MLLDLPRSVICSVARSTLSALKQQLGISRERPLPLLATCVRLIMTSRMKRWSYLIHCTAPSDGFSLQEERALISTGRSQDVSAF